MEPTTIAHPPTSERTETAQRAREPRALRSWRHETRQRWIETKENIREHPRQATLMALGAGLLLSFLPLAIMVTAVLRLGLIIAKPALLILGGIKALEEYRKSGTHHA